jgi:hypothetical protein
MGSMIDPTTLIERMAKDRSAFAYALDRVYPSARIKRINIWNSILDNEIESGSTFLVSMPDLTPYLCVGLTRETFVIPRSGKGGDKFWAYMDRRYGLTESEGNDNIARYILGRFRNYAMQQGSRVELRRFSAFRNLAERSTVYVSSYDGSMWRCDGENVMPIANGEDDVFFADDDGGRPSAVEVGQNNAFFDKLVNAISFAEVGMGGISAEQMRMAYVIWAFALAFPDLMPTKPLLILEGAPGSGKSASLQLLQRALLGKAKPIILSRNKEDDFGVLLLRSPICVFDNLDAYIDWIPDAVCAYTTAGEWTKRKFFTDSEELTLKPHAFIAVASKNPASFRREDVADRCIIMRLERRERFVRFQALADEVEASRPQILGEYLHYVNKIVAEIRGGALAEQDDEGSRMADFASLARIVGRVLNWNSEDVEELLVAMAAEQSAFFNEEDPLTDLLGRWLSYKTRGVGNQGREVPLYVLHAELESIAQGMSIDFYKSQRMLAQKLRSPYIEREFIIQMLAPDGRKSYRIWRKDTPRLTSVPMPEGIVSPSTDDDDEPPTIRIVADED